MKQETMATRQPIATEPNSGCAHTPNYTGHLIVYGGGWAEWADATAAPMDSKGHI